MASTVRSHRADPGSIPGIGDIFFWGKRNPESAAYLCQISNGETPHKLDTYQY
jgi:hypothetical protein